MKKLPKAKLNKMADNHLKRFKPYYLKLMERYARDGDLELLKMASDDFADSLFVCHEIKNGNYGIAADHYHEMDSDPQDKFGVGIINLLVEAADYEYHFNGEQ
jgi:hypothetical protein